MSLLWLVNHSTIYDDIISYVLAGLGHNYDSFVSSIYARTDQVTLEEAYSLLIVTEARLACHHLSTPIPDILLNNRY
jgi:hypothetical protein